VVSLELQHGSEQVEMVGTSLEIGQVMEGPAKLKMLYGVEKSVTDLVAAEPALAQSVVGGLGSCSLVDSGLDD
jgi:hypothetical protein